ncbi:hypothetical protein GF325_01685 [Candidatus Bathyarchaeota archaeon]|nr:hypothetical protein [Candidatus Bathyarchaeota archaeon]
MSILHENKDSPRDSRENHVRGSGSLADHASGDRHDKELDAGILAMESEYDDADEEEPGDFEDDDDEDDFEEGDLDEGDDEEDDDYDDDGAEPANTDDDFDYGDGDDDEDDDDESRERDIVVPGQVVGKVDADTQSGYGTLANKDNDIISLYIGFTQKRGKYLNVIPFKGCYLPHVGHKVIGKIVDKNVVLYKLDINSPYMAILKPSDNDRVSRSQGGRRSRYKKKGGPRSRSTTDEFDLGDIVIAKVLKFDRTTEPSLTTVGPDLGQIKGGFLTEIEVPKIPRLIGKSGSMIKLLNKLTSCKIFVAQNGMVWIKGSDPKKERVLIKAIRKIEQEAHTFGLTDRVKEFIDEQLGN